MPPLDPAWNADPELRAEGKRLRTVELDDFFAYMPMHNYIHRPSRMTWPAGSVNARLPPVDTVDKDGNPINIRASQWLDQNRPVEQMTWAPGQPTVIHDRLILEGGWIDHP